MCSFFPDWGLPEVPLGTHRGYCYNQTSELRHEAKEWLIEHLVEYLFKPIMVFGSLMIGCPIVREIWQWNSTRVSSPTSNTDSRSNAETSGAPSEIGEYEIPTPKCMSVFISKMQSPVDLLSHRCGNDVGSQCRLGKFDG